MKLEIAPKTMLHVLLVAAAVWIGVQLIPVLLVLVVALFLVGTLGPIVEWLEHRKIRRGIAIAMVFTFLLLLSAALAALTIPALVSQVSRLIEEEPAIRGKLADWLAGSHMTAPLAEWLRNFHYEAIAKAAAETALEFSTRAVSLVAYSASAVFLGLYLMIDRDRVRGGLFASVPRTHHIRLSRVMLNLEAIVGGYIRGQLITSALMSLFVFILLTSCGVENAIALAVFAGIADVLPYVGFFFSVGPVVLAALSRGPLIAAIVAVLMIAYEEFESRVLVPKIYGRALKLPSSVVMLALLAGATLGGILGALLALPVAAAIRMLIEELRVELPGEDIPDGALRERDERAEEEYERRAEGVPAKEAAAIAVEISDERRKEEGSPAEAAEVPITGGTRDDSKP